MASTDRRKKKNGTGNGFFKLIFMDWIQILGLSAGTITAITFLPQVIKIWQTKSVKDLSLYMLLLLMLGVTMWLVYGILLKNAAIIYTNSAVLLMSFIMLYFKLKYNK